MDNKERNEIILKVTCELLEKMNVEVEEAFVEDREGEDEEEQVLVGVKVGNPAGLIGFKGRNLASTQMVLAMMVKNKLGRWVRVLLDVNNYRDEQKRRLEKIVETLAEKVRQTGESAELPKMSSYERRICHMRAADLEGVVTESEGEEEERHVVIKPKV